jgi:hypothetical protein
VSAVEMQWASLMNKTHKRMNCKIKVSYLRNYEPTKCNHIWDVEAKLHANLDVSSRWR